MVIIEAILKYMGGLILNAVGIVIVLTLAASVFLLICYMLAGGFWLVVRFIEKIEALKK